MIAIHRISLFPCFPPVQQYVLFIDNNNEMGISRKADGDMMARAPHSTFQGRGRSLSFLFHKEEVVVYFSGKNYRLTG